DLVAAGDHVEEPKPAPDIYQLALRTLGLGADRAVAFEDSPNGLRAAVAAGLWTVVTPTFWTEGSDFAAAGLLLPGLGDPGSPLKSEPGTRLRTHGWLDFDELQRLARPARALDPVRALYQEGMR
ncbi:MAG TPA: HAD-IA family hydrolase, partial [Burkholderiaceae bacterium]